MSDKLTIVWTGFHEEGHSALKGVIEAGFNVKAIITLDNVGAAKRSGTRDYSPVANEHDIPLYKIGNINDASSIHLLNDLEPDVLCVIGWSQLLSSAALSTARMLTIGAHASLLPIGRGRAPVNWAIIRGMTRTGNTLMRLSEGVDSGDILAQREFDISIYDSCATLYGKVAESNRSMLIEVLGLLSEGKLVPQAQPKEVGEIWAGRRPQDGILNWDQEARQVYDFIRALTRPYPGAFSFVGGRKMTVWSASYSDAMCDTVPGSIQGFQYSFNPAACGVIVGCQNGCISLHEVEVEQEGLLFGEELISWFEGTREFDAIE